MLRVHLFGSGRLFDGDAEVKLPSRHWTLPLLAYLLVHRGASIPRRRLAFALWPDEPEEDALQNLRRNLHRLQKALPEADEATPWIEIDADSIAWNAAARCELDVAEFERLQSEPHTLERAISHYTGDLLEDVYDDWVGAERERLRRLYHAGLTSLVLTNRSRRNFTAAASFARRLLDADPWREDVVRHLMAVRYEAGDAAGALGEFDRFARALRADMNVAPMHETLALREAIARGEALPAAAAPPPAPAKRAPAAAPFVGRGAELNALRAGWERAAGGAGGLIFVRGDAGIGKSRLVCELALAAEAEGARVLSGRTSGPESDPYQCLTSALRGALPLIAGVSLGRPLLAAFAELVPELRAYRTDLPPLVRLDAESERARRLDALAQLLVALARPRPLLVILEDVHRAGPETVDALRELVPRLARSAVLMLATYRDDDPAQTQRLQMLERLPGVFAAIVPRPLEEAEIAQLVAALVPGASGAFVSVLVERSEGNPLFVTELLRDMARAGAEASAIPASLGAMIDGRLGTLAPASRAVAEVAAVAGEAFTVDMVGALSGIAHAQVLDGLDELLDRHLVRESPERTAYEYAFTHTLVHAAIYDGIPGPVRERRHRRLARLLDVPQRDDAGERAGEIARHYELGGEAARAALHYGAAARRAAGLNANAEARGLLDRALTLGPHDDAARFALLALRVKLDARLADADAEENDQCELERLAAGLDDDAACTALIRRIEIEFGRGNHRAEMEAIEKLTLRAQRDDSERWLAAAAEAQARRDQRNCVWAGAVDHALDARQRYERLGDDAGCVRATALAAQSCAFAPERADEAERYAAEAMQRAERSGDAELRVLSLRVASSVAHEREHFAREAELNRMALELCREFGDRRGEVFCRGRLATLLWDDWKIDEALAQYREALRLAESLDVARVSPTMCNLGGLLADVGDFAGARDACERAERLAIEQRMFGVAAVAALNLARIAWLRGDVEGLEVTLERAGPIVARLPQSRHEANFAKNRGRLLRCRGDVAGSLRELERAGELYGRHGRSANAAEVLDEVALTYLGAGRLGDAREALAAAESAARASSRESLTDPIAHSWIDACIRHAAGDVPGASVALGLAGHLRDARREGIADPLLRESFAALPVHRAMASALEGRWPDSAVRCAIAFAAPERRGDAGVLR